MNLQDRSKKESMYSILVTDMERRILIQALSQLKAKQIEKQKQYDFIDTLILRCCDALPGTQKYASHEER